MCIRDRGKYAFATLPAGSYTIQVDASGFNSSKRAGVQVASGQPTELPISLQLGNASEEITVEASEANSVAAAMAPMDALLEEHSARTEITQAFINNYTSPVSYTHLDVYKRQRQSSTNTAARIAEGVLRFT